jgi:hypothetical protein
MRWIAPANPSGRETTDLNASKKDGIWDKRMGTKSGPLNLNAPGGSFAELGVVYKHHINI